jgi:hypothetical protein
VAEYMTSAKRIGKRILYGFGKGLYLFGKGVYIFSKALAKVIGIAYRNYQERQRIEEERRRYYGEIEREGRAYGRGFAQGTADVHERQRAIRERNHRWQEAPREVDRLIYGDDSPRQRKKRRQFFDY